MAKTHIADAAAKRNSADAIAEHLEYLMVRLCADRRISDSEFRRIAKAVLEVMLPLIEERK